MEKSKTKNGRLNYVGIALKLLIALKQCKIGRGIFSIEKGLNLGHF